MNHWIDVLIMLLLPLSALFTVLQTNPYHALVSRGIMGAVAVLLYAVLGAPDVALTEALVGTLLTVILFAIAVRSSMVLRVGMLNPAPAKTPSLKRFCAHHNLALRRIFFDNEQSLIDALQAGRIDASQLSKETLRHHLPQLDPHPDKESVIVLAPHGRWHEANMKQLFGGSETLVRLEKPVAEGGA